MENQSFYELVFNEYSLSRSGFTQVCCPFPHISPTGEVYHEHRPSAGVNLDTGVFHCFACNISTSEVGFIARYLSVNFADANRIKQMFYNKETLDDWLTTGVQQLKQKPDIIDKIKELGFSDKVVQELHIGSNRDSSIDFPVIMFNSLIDVVSYRPGLIPKVIRRKHSPSGMIIPFDTWRNTDKSRLTVICAGEKDMAIARTYGFNAITITGGERSLPKLWTSQFKNRDIAIAYDNDETGRKGAKSLAVFLKPHAKSIRVLDLSPICVEEKEDVWDYFQKYHKTAEDFKTLIRNTTLFDETAYQEAKEQDFPTITLMQAGTPKYVNRTVRSNIQVISVIEDQFVVPSALRGTKIKLSTNPEDDSMALNEYRTWYLDEYNVRDILYLMDSKLKEKAIREHSLSLMGLLKEPNIELTHDATETIYKATVSDLLSADSESSRTEFLAYSIGNKLENGKKYLITYKLVPHPFDGQKLTMIILDIENPNDSISNFKITEVVKQQLKEFQTKPSETAQEKIKENINRVKGMLNANYDENLIMLIDLWFHSVLKFNIGSWTDIRGALDVLLVGESRTGKSSTAEVLMKMYGVGEKVAMTDATRAGLIGGSNKSNSGSYQTRSGILPMNHGGAVILEEMTKARDKDIVKSLTEIKSSGIAKIVRVNGVLELPCMLRTLAISNTKTVGDTSKPISSYPNGIAVVTDLIGAAEDVARFDLIAVFAFLANEDIDPFATYKQPWPQEYYRTRINWVWSRKPENIIFTKEIYEYLIKLSNELKREYDSYIKIFGTETWKKIARVAIAIAGYLVSTNSDFTEIIVLKEHIDIAAKFIVSLYDNPVFRLREYVSEERRMRDIDDDGVEALKRLYTTNVTIINHLENVSETSRNNLSAISGMNNDEFSKYINSLVSYDFITFQAHAIHPTERFRKGMRRIDKSKLKVQPLGKLIIGGTPNGNK